MSADSQLMQAISEQYGAAFKMLEQVIVDCHEDLWQDITGEIVISQVVYHTLYYVDLYLSKNQDERESFNGKYGDDRQPTNQPKKKFTRNQLISYLQEIREKADKRFTDLSIKELNAKPIFDWHGSSLLSSLLYDLRHIMLHVGALHVRLNNVKKLPLRWVDKYPEEEGTEMNELALWHLQEGNYSEAEKMYVELSSGSDNPLFYYNLACCYSLQKKVKLSIQTLKTCLQLDKENRFKNLAKSDKDFTNVRDLLEFKQIVNM